MYPEDVENHIPGNLKGKVASVACVGVEHHVYSEAIIVFVDPIEGETVTPETIMDAARDMVSYARPSHVEVLEPGAMPLNRVAKTDYMVLKEMARGLVARLRQEGKWDQ